MHSTSVMIKIYFFSVNKTYCVNHFCAVAGNLFQKEFLNWVIFFQEEKINLSGVHCTIPLASREENIRDKNDKTSITDEDINSPPWAIFGRVESDGKSQVDQIKHLTLDSGHVLEGKDLSLNSKYIKADAVSYGPQQKQVMSIKLQFSP